MPIIAAPGVTYSGPMFDGSSLRIVAAMMKDIDTAMGQAGVDLVRSELDSSLQNPTGFYRSQVEFTRNTKGATISDHGVIYGPWLEGTGSRNRTTKFKGYASFRKATQRLNQQATRIIQSTVDRYVAKLNGS